ncbi:MAG: cation:proton antiporter subunit C [Synergistaceae bacterium]|jgi:multicomponent Na+:H+ antiporter subunit C|nr:cation:proton antiporter subunit C [Synergistaceae bacterium]
MTDSIAKNASDFAGNAAYVVVALLVIMALYSILTQKNLIKICIGIAVLGSSVNFFLVLLGYRQRGGIPVYYLRGAGDAMVLPTPQCLTLTAIVIALATTALMLSLVILINKHYGTMNIDEIRRLRG